MIVVLEKTLRADYGWSLGLHGAWSFPADRRKVVLKKGAEIDVEPFGHDMCSYPSSGEILKIMYLDWIKATGWSVRGLGVHRYWYDRNGKKVNWTLPRYEAGGSEK